MLKLSTMNNSRNPRGSRGRPNAPDRGGIRKRGAARVDRDGDLDMDAGAGRSRGGKRARGDSGRSTPAGGQAPGRERALNAIQKAITSNVNSQANIRQPRERGGGLEQVIVRGWKQSKAASNPDGGVDSLIAFLERKAVPTDPKAAANTRVKITKVCATSPELWRSPKYLYSQRRPPISGLFSFWQDGIP